MDFLLTENQLILQATLKEFASTELEPSAAELDEDPKLSLEKVKKLNELGICGIGIPEDYGGSGGGTLEAVIATEELVRGCPSTGMGALASVSLCAHPINHFGTEEQKRRFVVPIARGQKFGAFALTESEAGSDISLIQTTATKQKGGYILDGIKIFITNGGIADTVIVFATVDKSSGRRGMTGFIVEKGMPGFSVGREENKLGVRGLTTTELIYDGCFVPEENRLGEEGDGFKIAMWAIDTNRVIVASQAIGIARGAYEASLQYSKERQQFGQPICNFQAIQWTLADMVTSISAARLLAYHAAYLHDSGQPFVTEAAMAKVFAAETAMAVTTKAIQIHGGYGYTTEYPVERSFRAAKLMEIHEGTSEMQRMTIARNILR
jgi:butyryl-CoA dehydrogenase